MNRTNRKFRPAPLEMFEDRVVPTVIPIAGPAYLNPGLAEPFVINGGAVSISRTTIIGDEITYELHNNNTASAVVVTYAIYSSPGGGPNPQNNLAPQRLEYQTTIAIPAGSDVTFAVDIKDLIDDGLLDLRGQRRFQCDFYINAANTAVAFAAPEFAVKPGSIQYASGNFITGELFDFTDAKGKR